MLCNCYLLCSNLQTSSAMGPETICAGILEESMQCEGCREGSAALKTWARKQELFYSIVKIPVGLKVSFFGFSALFIFFHLQREWSYSLLYFKMFSDFINNNHERQNVLILNYFCSFSMIACSVYVLISGLSWTFYLHSSLLIGFLELG